MIVKSLDTETTGIDLWHGASVFLVTMTDLRRPNRPFFWEWKVNPETRCVHVPVEDLKEIQAEIDEADEIVGQNLKFDIPFLRETYKKARLKFSWDWKKAFDTLIAGHLLSSSSPHDLTSSALIYLGINIESYELEMKELVDAARRYARSNHKNWRIAKEGLAEMPSAKEKTWKYDTWLPRCIAAEMKLPADHPNWTVTSKYANIDSEVTLPLGIKMKKLLEVRGLTKIFRSSMELPEVINAMEEYGVTCRESRLNELKQVYVEDSDKMGRVCLNIAAGLDYDLKLPKSGNNGSLTKFVFDVLKLPTVKASKKTGAASLDKTVIEHYQATLPHNSKELLFINSLRNKRKRDTGIGYMESYQKFWIPVFIVNSKTGAGWYRLHPHLNSTGTKTLRFSSSNPNEQNISKQGMPCTYCNGGGCVECHDEGLDPRSLRYCFGPAPGREWWSFDAMNIELRLPAYEANEREMINLFERPNDPPYYGSYHLLVFDILHPKLFKRYGKDCKKKFASTWYQWVKNGNFAVQYGAMISSGTADRAYHVPGAQARIMERFANIAALNKKMIAIAEECGYVETMPDKTVDPTRGYPLFCGRTQYGEIMPTEPLNYHIQGTAMWWMRKAMIRCHNYLRQLPDHHLIMQIHDELVFDFPAGTGKEPWKTNLPVTDKIKKLMSMGGDDVGVPTPVSREYHADNYSVGMSV